MGQGFVYTSLGRPEKHHWPSTPWLSWPRMGCVSAGIPVWTQCECHALDVGQGLLSWLLLLPSVWILSLSKGETSCLGGRKRDVHWQGAGWLPGDVQGLLLGQCHLLAWTRRHPHCGGRFWSWDVGDSGVKAISIEFNLNVRGLDMCVKVKGSEVGHGELFQASCGIENGGDATVDGGVPKFVQLDLPLYHQNEVGGVGHPLLLPWCGWAGFFHHSEECLKLSYFYLPPDPVD